MADASSGDLIDNDGLLGDNTGDFEYDLDDDAEAELLADDSTLNDQFNLTSEQNDYIDSDPKSGSKISRNIANIYSEVEEVAEGDEIIEEDEDILDLGVNDEIENELQDNQNSHNHKTWIKQEPVESNQRTTKTLKTVMFADNRKHTSDDYVSSLKHESHDGANVKNEKQSNFIVTSSTEVLEENERFFFNESDEEDLNDKDDEERGRFKTERTNVISLKKNNPNKWGKIPDTLDKVITKQKLDEVQTNSGPKRSYHSKSYNQSKQNSQSHKILINPHFKKTQDHIPHPQQARRPPWEVQPQIHNQLSYEPAGIAHNIPPQHFGCPYIPPPQHQPHIPPPNHGPPIPPQIYQHQIPHPPAPQLPPRPIAPSWVMNEGPPPPQHFDQHYNSGPPQPQFYPHAGPPQNSGGIYHGPPPQQPMFDQHFHQPQVPAPHIEFQRQIQLPTPPGVDDTTEESPSIRTVQFSRNSQQITVQMTNTPTAAGPVYNTNPHLDPNIRPPPHVQPQNNWINRGMAPPPAHLPPHIPQHRPHFMLPRQRPPNAMQHPLPNTSIQPFPPGLNPGFGQGDNIRWCVRQRFPPPHHSNPMYPPVDIPPQQNMMHPAGPGVEPQGIIRPPFGPLGKRLGKVQQSPPVPYKQPRFSNKNKNSQKINQLHLQNQRKTPVVRNLTEISTVNVNTPDTTTKFDQPQEDEDDETKQYRLKIEEQKQLRKKILLQKEMRRQQAAVKKQQELQQKTGNENPNESLTQSPDQNQPQPSVHQRVGKKMPVVESMHIDQESEIVSYKIVKVRAKDGSIHIKKLPMKKDGQLVMGVQVKNHNPTKQFIPVLNRRTVLDDQIAKTKVYANWARKKALKKNVYSGHLTTIIPNKSMTLGQRFSIQASKNTEPSSIKNIVNTAQSAVVKSNRKVINSIDSSESANSKIEIFTAPPGPVSHTVVIDNLTANTSKNQLIQMACQVGEVEKLDLESKLKRATIRFKTTSSASAFYLKFQRKMVNLSMINVSIVPE